MKFGLNQDTINKLNSVFKMYSTVEEVLIYGSRAKGNYKNGSDIDLTLIGENITEQDLAKIDTDIDDLLLPYTVDLSIMKFIENSDLLDHIKRVGKAFKM